MWEGFPLFPEAASSIAGDVDSLYFFLTAVATFFSGLIFILILYFAVKYRRGVQRGARHTQDPETHPGHEGHIGLEIVWTVIPFVLTMVMFAWGASLYLANARVPDGATEISVVGRQWMWKIQHPSGRREINELHVPIGEPIKLRLATQDVIHSFFIPAFRVKMDVVPGRYTQLWFEATKTGEFHLFCAEYCGTEHSRMIGRVIVMEPNEFQRWLGGVTDETPVQAGEKLFSEFNCVNCHSTGQRQRCPLLGGLFGKPVRLADGGEVMFDEAYIRESIINPNAKITSGYRPIMPTYRGQISEEQILQLVAYIRSLTPQSN